MIERPILFSAPMIRAVIEDRKTETRRVVRVPADAKLLGMLERRRTATEEPRLKAWLQTAEGSVEVACPYGKPGDRLWVREAFSGRYGYEVAQTKPSEWSPADPIWYWADGDPPDGDWTRPKPSIHMPRWASRILLEVTDVRVERLHEISEADARAEGVVWDEAQRWFHVPGVEHPNRDFPILARATAREMYAALWDTINGAGSWLGNPWVWVVKFRRVR